MKRPLIDPQLKFDESKHIYKLGRTKLRSVTKWIKDFFQPFDEEKWANIALTRRQADGEDVTIEQIKQEWKDKADYGVVVHAQMEEYVKNNTPPTDPRAIIGAQFYDQYKETANVLKAFPELRIYSEDLLLAGTIDLLVMKRDGSVEIIDWKTNKKLYKRGMPSTHEAIMGLPDVNYTHYTLQLSTYAYLIEKHYGYNVSKLTIVHIEPDNVTVHDVPYLKEVITRMIEHDQKPKATVGTTSTTFNTTTKPKRSRTKSN